MNNTNNERALASAERLERLLPDLEDCRETHRQWRDCAQRWRDMNPSIGNAAFHAQYVKNYDERIAAIKEAVSILRAG